MFDDINDAHDLNSDCAFCGKQKFQILGLSGGKYDLVRCSEENCSEHCQWKHKPIEVELNLVGEDAVAIVSGW